MHRRATATGFFGVLLMAGTAQADYFGAPSITAALVDDDNLFFTPDDPQRDRIRRVSPGLEAGYESAPLTWRALLTTDAEEYDHHPELDNSRARDHATLDVRYEPERRLSLAMNASYTRTQTPGELTPETGLDFERGEAERLALSPSLTARLGRRTVGFASYGFTRDALEGGADGDTHVAGLGLGRQASRRDTASLEYRYRQVGVASDVRGSHAVLGGLTRRFTERTTASVTAGPRWSDGALDLEASAGLRHALTGGELSLDYARTETTVIGFPGTAATQSLGASASSLVGLLDWRLGCSRVSTDLDDRQVDATVLDLRLGMRMTRLISLFGSYSHRAQDGRLEIAGDAYVARAIVMLGVDIRAPRRDGDEEAQPSRRPSKRERPWESGTDSGPEEP